MLAPVLMLALVLVLSPVEVQVMAPLIHRQVVSRLYQLKLG
eukprot:SAG22_NODE_1240_length_5042_cov_103.645964_1_plen_41_part_00